MTVAEFIKARIEEEEALAREAIEPKNMHPYGDDRLPAITSAEVPDGVRGYLGGAWGEHFAHHDPVRVLRELAAKRQRLSQLEYMAQWNDEHQAGVTEHEIRMMRTAAKLLLQIEAHPWSAHPDFDRSWRSIFVDEPAGLYERTDTP